MYVTLSCQSTASVGRQYIGEVSKTDNAVALVATHLSSSTIWELLHFIRLNEFKHKECWATVSRKSEANRYQFFVATRRADELIRRWAEIRHGVLVFRVHRMPFHDAPIYKPWLPSSSPWFRTLANIPGREIQSRASSWDNGVVGILETNSATKF